jgi:hypothetical protein
VAFESSPPLGNAGELVVLSNGMEPVGVVATGWDVVAGSSPLDFECAEGAA